MTVVTDPSVVLNMTQAVLGRLVPAVTRWNRLEGRPRTHNFDRALKAEVRDALWMLARQWQLGEFQGDDAGSPVLARACIDVSTINRYQAAQGPVAPLDLGTPLEATVEQRPPPLRSGAQILALDLRLAVGRRWLKLLAREAARPGGLSADYRAAYLTRYTVAAPDPTAPADAAVCAHPDAWQQVSAAAGRAMDGVALLEYCAVPGNNAFDGVGAAATDEPLLAALAGRLRDWFADLIMAPPPEDQDAWLPERLEYQFGLEAGPPTPAEGGGPLVLRAEEYAHGHLDWYALERRPGAAGLGGPDDAPPPAAPLDRRVHTFLPTALVFDGMPHTRWWSFEDRRTNFGAVRPDTTDLGKLLLMEFALVHANDWFVLPYTLPVGCVAEVKGIAVSNVFGERVWVEPVRERPAADWAAWGMFTLSAAGAERRPPPARLVLLPTVPQLQQGPPLEEVALTRDEMANMVWAIEGRIVLPSGRSRPGGEAARELRRHLERLAGPPPGPPPAPAAPLRYEVMSSVPEQWIPFIPVHVADSVRETQLQRAALPRLIPGAAPAKIRPRTTLLRHGLPRAYFIYEEEVPRVGVVVSQAYQRTRWVGGKVYTWFGARKRTGRGEGSSGLRFDRLISV